MATMLHTTAQIIPFPGPRRDRGMPEKSKESVFDTPYRAPVMPAGFDTVECGSAWYHDAAIDDANLSRP